MCDATGLVNFMNAVADFARGATQPSLLPLWDRHLLSSRNPPRVTFTHHEYIEVLNPNDHHLPLDPITNQSQRSFFFPRTQLLALRHHLRLNCSILDILTALIWKCRIIALNIDPEEEVRVMSLVNARGKFKPELPRGYYGNGFVFPAAVAKARELKERGLGYGVELVWKAKEMVSEEYVRSVGDLMAKTERRSVFPVEGTWIVSDNTKAGLGEVDYGWGKAVYGGVGIGGRGNVGVLSYYTRVINRKGEEGVAVPICFPTGGFMARFEEEIRPMMLIGKVENDAGGDDDDDDAIKTRKHRGSYIVSSL